MVTVSQTPHPLLAAVAFETEFASPLGEVKEAVEATRAFAPGAEAPIASDENVRAAVRDLLRHGGYKPTGRGKPASEYLIKASTEGTLSRINAAVDVCNAVSLHSGLPISVVDLDRAKVPLSLRIAGDQAYVFNASGQTIDVSGLLCLFDADGPCANAVKDSQRTKTHGETRRTLSIIWGARSLGDRGERAFAWYEHLLRLVDAQVKRIEITVEGTP